MGQLQQGVERLVGQPQHLEDLLLRQAFTPLEHLVAGDVEDLGNWSSSRLGSLPCATERRGQSVTRGTGERGGVEPARPGGDGAEQRHTR